MHLTQPKVFSRSGMLHVSYSLNGKQCRQSLKLKDTKQNKRLAQQKIIPNLLSTIYSQDFLKKQKSKTIDEMMSLSIEIHKNNRRELTTQEYIKTYNRHIKPYFGKREIESIKPSELSSWQNALHEKIGTRRIHNIRTIFNAFFEDARKDEFIDKNPFSLVDRLKNDENKDIDPFSLEEIDLILSHAQGKSKAFFALGFYSGMRLGEMIALKWDNIDFINKKIHIKHSIRQGIESLPKTKNSIRKIDMLEPLIPYLLEHKKQARADSIYVFETLKNEPYTTSDKITSHYWKPLLKELEIKHRVLYQMRHTFASMMISHGEDILWVSYMLGHKDSTTTLQTYAKYIKHENKKRATFLNCSSTI